jgi:hypothetical protein
MTMVPNVSRGPIALGFGGWVGGPVDVSTASGCGEADGATASRLVVGAGVPRGRVDGVAVGSAAGPCVTATGAVAADDGQTWSKPTDGGGAPKADV